MLSEFRLFASRFEKGVVCALFLQEIGFLSIELWDRADVGLL